MKEMMRGLLAQSKEKAKLSDPILEYSMGGTGGGGNQPPPRWLGAPGAPGGGDSDDARERSRKGRWDNRLARQSRRPNENNSNNDEEEDPASTTVDELRLSQVLDKAIGEISKRLAQLSLEYEHTKHYDIRFWLTACKYFFDQNPYQ